MRSEQHSTYGKFFGPSDDYLDVDCNLGFHSCLYISVSIYRESYSIHEGVGISFAALLVALLSFIAFRLFRNSQSNPPDLGRADEDTSESKNLEQSNVNTRIK